MIRSCITIASIIFVSSYLALAQMGTVQTITYVAESPNPVSYGSPAGITLTAYASVFGGGPVIESTLIFCTQTGGGVAPYTFQLGPVDSSGSITAVVPSNLSPGLYSVVCGATGGPNNYTDNPILDSPASFTVSGNGCNATDSHWQENQSIDEFDWIEWALYADLTPNPASQPPPNLVTGYGTTTQSGYIGCDSQPLPQTATQPVVTSLGFVPQLDGGIIFSWQLYNAIPQKGLACTSGDCNGYVNMQPPFLQYQGTRSYPDQFDAHCY